MFRRNVVGRRTVLASGAGALAGLAAPHVARAQAVTVSVGRQPWGGCNSLITQDMMNNRQFEKRAKELGYDVTVDWRDDPSAQPMVEVFVSNNLDLGIWGTTPIIRGLAARQPWLVLNVAEGHLRLVLATRAGSPIHNVQDLKGKTVGVLLGGDPYNVLSQLLLIQLGSGNPKDLDIRLVNTPTEAQAATVPRGMDAVVLVYPFFLKAQKEVGAVGIANWYGLTEAYDDGAARKRRWPPASGTPRSRPSTRRASTSIGRSGWPASAVLTKYSMGSITAFLAAQQDTVSGAEGDAAGRGFRPGPENTGTCRPTSAPG